MDRMKPYRKVLSAMMYLFLRPDRHLLHYPEDAMLLEGVAQKLQPSGIDVDAEWTKMERHWRKLMPMPKSLRVKDYKEQHQ